MEKHLHVINALQSMSQKSIGDQDKINEEENNQYKSKNEIYLNNESGLITPTYSIKKPIIIKNVKPKLRASKTLQSQKCQELDLSDKTDKYLIQEPVDIDLIHNDVSILVNQYLDNNQNNALVEVFKKKYSSLIELYSGYIYLILLMKEFSDFDIVNYLIIPYYIADLSKNQDFKRNKMICKRNNIFLSIIIIANKLKNKEITHECLPIFNENDFEFIETLVEKFKNILLDNGNFNISYEVEIVLLTLLNYKTVAESILLKYNSYYKDFLKKIGIEDIELNHCFKDFLTDTLNKNKIQEFSNTEIIIYRKVINSTAKRDFYFGLEFLMKKGENVLLAAEGRIWRTIGSVMAPGKVYKLWEIYSKLLNDIAIIKSEDIEDLTFINTIKIEYGKKIMKLVEDEDKFSRNKSLIEEKKEEYKTFNHHKRFLCKDLNLPFVKTFPDLLLVFFKYNLKSLVMYFLDKQRKQNKEMGLNSNTNPNFNTFIRRENRKETEDAKNKLNIDIFETCLIYDEDICINILDNCLNNDNAKGWYVHFCLLKKYFRLTRKLLKFKKCKFEIINFECNKNFNHLMEYKNVASMNKSRNNEFNYNNREDSQIINFIKEDDSYKNYSGAVLSSNNTKISFLSLVSKNKTSSSNFHKPEKIIIQDDEMNSTNNLENENTKYNNSSSNNNNSNSNNSINYKPQVKKSGRSSFYGQSSNNELISNNNNNFLSLLNIGKKISILEKNNLLINNNEEENLETNNCLFNKKTQDNILGINKPKSDKRLNIFNFSAIKELNQKNILQMKDENKIDNKLKFDLKQKKTFLGKENSNIFLDWKKQNIGKINIEENKPLKITNNNENTDNEIHTPGQGSTTEPIIKIYTAVEESRELDGKEIERKLKDFPNINFKKQTVITNNANHAELLNDIESENNSFSSMKNLALLNNLKDKNNTKNVEDSEEALSPIRRKINTTNYFLDKIKVNEKNEKNFFKKFAYNNYKIDLFTILIENIRYGHYLFDILILLEIIPFKKYTLEMCEKICQYLNSYNSNEEAIITCPRPLLSLALAAELLTKLGKIFDKIKFRMESVSKNLLFLAYHIQTSLTNEDTIIFYLKTQTDINGRSALEIYAENRFFDVLEDPNVGLLIGKLWNGTSEHEINIYDFWRITRILKANIFEEEYESLIEQNLNSFFSFQFYRYSRNCSERNFYESFSTMGITLLYQYVVYAYVTFTKTNEKHPKTHHYYIVQQVTNIFMFLSVLNDFFSHVFFRLTGRIVKYDVVKVIVDIILFVFIIINFFDLPEIFYPVEKDADWNIQLDGIVYSVLLLMAWMKVFLVLMITKLYGPFIRIMFSIFWHVVSFFIIVICITFLFAQCFCLYFKNSDENYKLFFESFVTLFNTAWGQLDFTFTDLDIFGEICLIAFTTLSNIMLFNLIVAIVNNLFDSYHERAEAESRAKLVLAHERKKWDDRYGLLILFPAPLNIFPLLLLPFLYLSKDQNLKKNNVLLSKICYFYIAFLTFIYFLVLGILCYLLTLIKSIIHSSYCIIISAQENKCKIIFFSILKRPIELLLYLIKDSFLFWILIFKEPEINEDEKIKESSSKRGYIMTFRNILLEAKNRENKSKISVGEAYKKLNIKKRDENFIRCETLSTTPNKYENTEKDDGIIKSILEILGLDKLIYHENSNNNNNNLKKETIDNSRLSLIPNNINEESKFGNSTISRSMLKQDNNTSFLIKRSLIADPYKNKKSKIRVKIKLELKALIDKFVDPEEYIDIERTLTLLPDRITYDNDFMEYLKHFNIRTLINGTRKYYFSLEEDNPIYSFQRINLLVFKLMMKLKLIYNYLPDKTKHAIKMDFTTNANIKKFEKTPEIFQKYEERDNVSDYDDEGKYIINEDYKTDANTAISSPNNISFDRITNNVHRNSKDKIDNGN